MEITRRCDYACRIIRAAYKRGESYVSIAEIADEEDIPYSFARSIQHELVQVGLVKTTRGARGGLTLNCDPEKVTVLDVMKAVQGPVGVSPCSIDRKFCNKSAECDFHQVWAAADKQMNELLGSITLADMFRKGSAHPAIAQVLES